MHVSHLSNNMMTELYRPSVCVSVGLSVSQSVCLSVSLSVSLSVCLSVAPESSNLSIKSCYA